MHIDMHFAATYVAGRLAGFDKDEAKTIAWSSQYVDDAIHEDTLKFNNHAAYRFIPSAHKMKDYRNFRELANHLVWIPFHFIPGNQLCPKLEEQGVPEFVQRVVCRPGSQIAYDMMESCMVDRDAPNALHRLGIAIHAFVDTWSHQGFAGISHEVNSVHAILDWEENHHHKMNSYVKKYFRRSLWKWLRDTILSFLIGEVNPIGHGPVLAYPDIPFLKWKYKDFMGNTVTRDNPKDFLEAIKSMHKVFVRYKLNDSKAEVEGISHEDWMVIEDLVRNNDTEDKYKRLEKWIKMVKNGKFSFGPEDIHYDHMEWPKIALEFDEDGELITRDLDFHDQFMNSEWKKLHDAIIKHRSIILHDILPKHGICAA